MKVLFTRVDPIPAHASAHPSSGSLKHGGTLATTSTSPMTHKRSHKPTATQPRLIKNQVGGCIDVWSRRRVLRTLELPLNLDDTFALDCKDSLDLQKPCDPPSIIAPGDIVQAPRLIRGVATGSEESFQIVQATTSGWVVVRLGLPGAKVRRATHDGAEGWIVEQPLRKPLQWSKWFGSRRRGIDAADGGCAMQSSLGSRGSQSSPCTRRFFFYF